MPKLIKGDAVVDNHWHFIAADFSGEQPSGNLLVPLAQWLQDSANPEHAPWIASDDEFEEVVPKLLEAPLIAIHFPAFSDGRGFSTARLLRERYGYQGELRAVGHVIQDQLFFLRRCGFDAYDLRQGTDLEAALSSLTDFSASYQAATDTSQPLFRLRR